MADGCYLDDVKPDAVHQGGINLFGERFGDHNQAIVMRLDCKAK